MNYTDYKLCATVHRCLQCKTPPYLADLCTPVSDIASRQHLRSVSSNQLVVPCHRRTQFGRRAFSVAGPMAWNALPDSIRDTALSTCSFRRYPKTLFFLLLAYQCIRGFAFMRYINPWLIDWLTDWLIDILPLPSQPKHKWTGISSSYTYYRPFWATAASAAAFLVICCLQHYAVQDDVCCLLC